MGLSSAGYVDILLTVVQLHTSHRFLASKNRPQVANKRLQVDLNYLPLRQSLMPRIGPRISSGGSSMVIQHRRSQGLKHQIVANKSSKKKGSV
jgi:hypothetical protein